MMRRYSEPPEDILSGRWPHVNALDSKLLEYVKPIVDDVRRRGDKAVREYTERFDKVKINELRVQPEEVQKEARNSGGKTAETSLL